MSVRVPGEQDWVDQVGDDADTEDGGKDVPACEELIKLSVELLDNGAASSHNS